MNMLKTIVTLMRGAASRAEEEVTDRSALLILDQQIRDSAAGIERAKRALAIAIAQDEAEGKRLETTLSRISDLEERAVAALNGGRDELAGEAAEAIAVNDAAVVPGGRTPGTTILMNHSNVQFAALRAAVLVPVLLGVQRQFPQERAGVPDPVQDRGSPKPRR
jgi:hypothetical protein